MGYDFDLIVLGAGSGGLPIIRSAQQFGLKTAIVEKEKIGGDCLNFGCVPSKTFLKSARVLQMMRNADRYGVDPVEVKADFPRIMQRLRRVQAKIEEHESNEYFESRGVEVFIGSPRFTDNHAIEVNGRVLTSKKFVIATGSRAALPPIAGLDSKVALTNVEIFQLSQLPPSLLVLGGGPIGVEMAQAFRRFGSQVTLVEQMPTILPREDPELAEALQDRLRGEGIAIHTDASVIEVLSESPGSATKCVKVRYRDDSERLLEGDEILVAAGRRPNVEGLDLEKAGVKYGKAGIRVGRGMRTSAPNIWAVGDVVGPYYFSHTAAHQSGVAFASIFLRVPAKQDLSLVPWVTFTDPELARAGLTEQEAEREGIPFESARFDLSELDRAVTESDTEGFAKILISKGKIIGVHMLGSHAGDVFHTLLLAMRQRIPVSKVARMIYVYPTNAEIINRTLGQYFLKRIYSERMKRLVRFLF